MQRGGGQSGGGQWQWTAVNVVNATRRRRGMWAREQAELAADMHSHGRAAVPLDDGRNEGLV